MSLFWQVDFPALMAAGLASSLCALLGNFLLLRRESLLGDAIAHAVLPGIVGGFLLAGALAGAAMLAGALAAALLATGAIHVVRRLGRIEPGAAMGAVFTVMFAAGVFMLEQAAAENLHIDADCVLYGQLEDILWLEAPAIGALPREIWVLAGAFAAAAAASLLLAKEIRLATFDPAFAAALGFRPGLIHLGLVLFVAAAAIASFEAVGSILVIAMLICPPAAARLMTDDYRTQILLSTALGAGCALAGYGLAGFAPALFGASWSLNAAGCIASVSGVVVAAAAVKGRRRRSAGPDTASLGAAG